MRHFRANSGRGPVKRCSNHESGSLRLFVLSLLLSMPVTGIRAADAPIPLWPGKVPGESAEIGEEKDVTKPGDNLVAGKSLIRLGNVSAPSLQLFRPPRDRDTGATVLVCP